MSNNNSSNNNNRGGKNGKNGGFRGVLTLIAWALVLTVAFQYFNAYNNNAANKSTSHEIKYSDMISMIEKDQVKEILFKDSTIYVTPVDGYVFTEEVTSGSKTETKTYTQSKDSGLTLYTVYLSNADLLPLLEKHNVAYTGFYEAKMSPFLMIMIQYILPTIFIVGAFMLVMRLMSKSGGGGFGGIGSVGKSNAKVYMEKSTGVTFKDVAGQDEAKESLEEIIDFLHNPGKYTAIGAKLPKGALLVGSPGTGKTLLAKAVAGEAGVPFFSISGSDFVEMFVGVGADLANLVNEAALRAVRKGRRAVNQDDLLVSFELVIAGSEKKGTVITEAEKRIIAYHEVGHALVAAKQKNAQPVSKITIVPHTQGALGYTLHLPEEEKFLMSREDILTEIRTLLAGRSSEEVVCNTMTSGAANDIERATEMARNLVARFGMCDEFDMMALGSVQSQYLDGGYSMTCAQETYAAADRETIKILRQCHEEAKQILRENRELLDKIAAYLLKKETITGQEMMAIIEGRDPETVDNYGASKSSQPAFRPSVPETIEAPARHINIVSEPIPMPNYDEKPEDKDPESTPAEDKPAEHADGDPE